MIKTQRKLSIRRQCELLRVNRSGFYYEPVAQDPDQLALMKRIDEIHLKGERFTVAAWAPSNRFSPTSRTRVCDDSHFGVRRR